MTQKVKTTMIASVSGTPKTRATRVYKRSARTTAEKNRRIKTHVERVRHADAASTRATWKLADELALLAQVYKECYGHDPSASKLRALTQIERNGSRQLLYARVAVFFPSHLRQHGVGVRVYEEAHKCNQALKRQGRQTYTAEEIAKSIESGSRTAETIRMKMEYGAAIRDQSTTVAHRKANRELALKHPAAIVKNKKRWLKMIEQDPDRAIAAAIAINDDATTIHRINDALRQLGCSWHLRSTIQYEEPDMFEEEP